MKRRASGGLKEKRTLQRTKSSQNINTVIHRPLHIKPELKAKDVRFTASVPAFGSWVVAGLMNGLQTGGAIDQRVGRKVNWTKMLIRAKFSAAQAIPPTTDTRIRILIVYDKQTNGSAPTVASVLASDRFESPMNLDNRDRFVIIADQEVPQCIGLNNYTGTITMNRKFNLETVFNDNGAGTVADINTGSIYCLYCGADENFGTAIATSVYSRMRFIDF